MPGAGLLRELVSLRGVILIDSLIFLFAVTVLLLTHIPPLIATHRAEDKKPSLLRNAIDG